MLVCISLSACAQTKRNTTKRKPVAENREPATLLQATSQKTLPGRPENEPTTDYRFVIVWNGDKEPASFFWRGENSWQACEVTRVKNFKPLVIKNNGIPQSLNYENDDPGNISYKKGDTLELYPITMGKHPMPDEISKEKNNVIYYKEVNGQWMALPVEKITKLPTIAMP
ncbi:MAG TPA: hypothetical protein VIN07_09260 [Flavipsychrobacter sp.]